MNTKKPVPMVVTFHGKRCPICGKASYSRSGIHPQCAVEQADEKIRTHLKQEKIA